MGNVFAMRNGIENEYLEGDRAGYINGNGEEIYLGKT